LVYHYKGFLKFIQAVAKSKEKIVIDIEKDYKNKIQVMMDVNTSKLKSPVILIDPTYKQRNVAAALSEETFEKFQKVCKAFLRNPSVKFFKLQEIDFEKLKANAREKVFESILLEAKTNRQPGDIAGSKLLKFHRHLSEEIKKYFEIKNKIFDYNDGKTAKYFFAVKSKGEILIKGPNINDELNVARFKKKHKKVFIKKGKVYSKKKIDFRIKEFIEKWKVKNKKRINKMSVIELKVV